MSNYSLVLNHNKQPLDPIHPSTARRLLKAGKAAVYRLYPFTIIYKQEVEQTPTPIAIKLDPGSKTTGIALVQADRVIWATELTHRGQNISASLESRSAIRGNRRARKTRYRPARFLNRTRPKGWLAPSLQHRVETTLTWVNKLIKFAPIGSIVQELVRFDANICSTNGTDNVLIAKLKTCRSKLNTLSRKRKGDLIASLIYVLLVINAIRRKGH